ncbi:MAG TPA: R2-like ligand-binding oxidase [Ktedonobacterales bacterium]|nr:R2-like ligand-binding oxidase [Ktedonobacterales bacterium]
MASISLKREGYTTISTRGLNFDSIPMRLFQKAKRLGTWDPFSIDFSKDKQDWPTLDELHHENLLSLSTLFQAGEEAVTLDLLPLVMRVAQQGRLEEEIYLTSFLWEEAKHTEFFRRWFSEVPQVDYDLHDYLGPNYKRIFFEELPKTMERLLHDDSPEALVHALVTYNMVVEGTLAETGYWSYGRLLERDKYLPGLAQGIRYIQRDESRHIRFGIYMLQLLVNENPALWDVLQAKMFELLPIAIGLTTDNMENFEEQFGQGNFLIPPEETQVYLQTQFQKRMNALARARGQSRAELEQEVAAEIEADEQEGAEVASD